MRIKLIWAILTIIVSCNNNTVREKAITINDLMNSDSASRNWNIRDHKPKDLQIDRLEFMDKPAYWITTYRIDSGRLEAFTEFIFESDKVFDKATYKWINDSTLNFKMINSSNDSALNCSMMFNSNGNASFSIPQGNQ